MVERSKVHYLYFSDHCQEAILEQEH